MADERAVLEAELDALIAEGERRRAVAVAREPFLTGLRPAASDWLTLAEVNRMCDLQAGLVPFRYDDMIAARERVAAKRAARVAQRGAV